MIIAEKFDNFAEVSNETCPSSLGQKLTKLWDFKIEFGKKKIGNFFYNIKLYTSANFCP